MDIQSISTLSMMANAASTQDVVSTAVLKMSLDDYELMGAQMTKMLEQSVTPHIGQNFDVIV